MPTNVPNSERIQIGFFGATNVGKSSLINALTGQDLSLVSDVPGTTTDPVKKAMELLPLGPVVLIDTAGFDDQSVLGEQRMAKTRQVLRGCDFAVLVAEAGKALPETEDALLAEFKKRALPHLLVRTKADLLPAIPDPRENEIYVSVKNGFQINECKELIARLAKPEEIERMIVADLLHDGDLVLLVTPIDESAPKGRLILPQQLVLRECLDHHMQVHLCQDGEVEQALSLFALKPALVVTDSQVYEKVAALVPDDIPLTSFSILFARYKGELSQLLEGLDALTTLRDGDTVLISEGCTHHRQCNDIGTKKMPDWIRGYTAVSPEFRFTAGGEFPEDLKGIKLVVHCGACMLNEKEMRARMTIAQAQGVPMTNYGMAIAKMHGILDRALKPMHLT